MPVIPNVSGGALPETSRRSYIASAPFNSALFTYTPPVLNVHGAIATPGSLAPIAGGNASTCPARRVLRETGKKLYPGVHSGILTYMVSVYDNVNLWHGYIDPNSPLFAVYSTDKPNFLSDGVDALTGAPADAGVPVITNGLVSAGQSVSAGTTVSAGTSVSAGTTVTAGTFVYAGSGIGYATGSGGEKDQETDIYTAVELDKPTGRINLVQTNLVSGAVAQFKLNNSFIGPNDMVVAGADRGGYQVNANVDAAGSCFIIVRNWTAGPLNESIRIQFAVIKGALA